MLVYVPYPKVQALVIGWVELPPKGSRIAD